MFIFHILKREDRRLRVIAVIVGTGLFVLLAGLWVVQIVCASHFANNSRRQSLKQVGMPAIRGKILDRNGRALADNRAQYNAILYLEDLQWQFGEAYARLSKAYGRDHPPAVQANGRVRLTAATSRDLQLEADCQVVSNIAFEVGQSLQEPRILNTNAFLRHYTNYPYVPYEIVPNLAPRQVARFAEQLSGQPDLEMETQPVRSYPYGALAAHVLGYVRRESFDVEQIPDYVGKTGVERVYDAELRGRPGVKLVLVNSLNYRQREDVETPNEPGGDIYLTIDLALQRAAEQALAAAQAKARGAVVVMDVRNGDILVMASAPAFDPNSYVAGLTQSELAFLNDPKLTPQINRAIGGAYPPGSTFKIITSIACLESGLDPDEVFNSPGEYQASPTARPIKDTAGPGLFDFNRGFYRSSNTYFIHYGLKAGLRKILEVAKRFHLGEKTKFPIGAEVAGNVPGPDMAGVSLLRSSTPDVCIGQEITTTPVQMASVIAAIANGGAIYWPRLVSHSFSPATGEEEELFAPGRLRDRVEIRPRDLELIRRAMLNDTEHAADSTAGAGTAYKEFHQANGEPKLRNFRVAGKTGTAEVKSTSANSPRSITWFDSYGPYENPRYAVVVMVEDGSFGGPTCAPVAEKIYEAIIKREQSNNAPASTLARN
ncbi:MAG: peptidoglycan D,D-transpeptidase FtsI family protein [Limisphaerales bacterium]